MNAAFRLETATKGLVGGVMIGDASYRRLALSELGPFAQRQVELKGYDAPGKTWTVSFDELRSFLASGR